MKPVIFFITVLFMFFFLQCYAQFSGQKIIQEKKFYCSDYIYLEDFDEDGDQDVLSLRLAKSFGMVMYENDGSGKFSEPIFLGRTSGKVYNHMFKDLNNNGKKDLIIAQRENKTSKLSWYQIGGREEINKTPILEEISNEFQFLDFNLDGKLDLITIKNKQLYLFTNKGDFQFDDGQLLLDKSFDNNAKIRVGDLDGDDIEEVIIIGRDHLMYQINRIPSSKQVSLDTININSLKNIYDISILDIDNRDGLDILLYTVSPSNDRAKFICLKNIGNGKFQSPEIIANLNHPIKGKIASFDVDKDGDLDLFNQQAKGNIDLYYHENQGDGKFIKKGFSVEEEFNHKVRPRLRLHDDTHFCFGDLDKDSDTDILLANFGIYLLPNDGNSNFNEIIPVEEEFAAGPIGLLSSGKDGKVDIINYFPGKRQSTTVDVLSWEKQDSFSKKTYPFFQKNPVHKPSFIDLNQDGYFDVLGFEQRDFVCYFGSESQSFDRVEIANDLRGHINFQVQDFNEDGKPDILLTSKRGIYKLENKGNQLFSEEIVLENDFGFARYLLWNDFNGDQRLDIAFVSEKGRINQALVYLKNEDGSYQKDSLFTPTPDYNRHPQLYLGQNPQNKNRTSLIISTYTPRINFDSLFWFPDGVQNVPSFLTTLPKVCNFIEAADYNQDSIIDIFAILNESAWRKPFVMSSSPNKPYGMNIIDNSINYRQMFCKLGDLDGDGDLDLIVNFADNRLFYPYYGKLVWYENLNH